MTVRDDSIWIDGATWIDQLPSGLRDSVRSKMTFINVAAGQILVDRGSRPIGVYEIVTGRLKLSVYLQNGKEMAFGIFGRPFTFGESVAILNMAHTLTAVAHEKSRVGLLKTRQFNEMRARHPEINDLVLKSASMRLTSLVTTYVDMCVLSLEERLASRLHNVALAAGKKDRNKKKSDAYTLHLRQDDLANMLGVARQSINKVLKDWETGGLIELTYGGLVVNDMSALLRIAVQLDGMTSSEY